ncbi:MAG: hypothetical protein BGO11_12670 [Solirubrobacterales bacterium 70-9]|nr:MAG: hypothetical protein BGO11_12670 [Solirubrobacterales bacterium 70-9]
MGTTALPGGAPVPVDPRRVLARLLAENFGDRGPTVRLSIPLWPEAEEPLRPGSAAPVPTRIVRGLEASGYPLLGLGPDPGGAWQTLTLDYVGALAAADAAVVARTAGIEIAGALAPGGAAMEIEADLRRQCPDAETVEARLADLCLLLRPTVESYASGARPGPVSAVRVDGSRLRCRLASGDANPYLAVAGLLASVAVDAPSEDDPTFPTSLGEAAARFEQAAWLADWFEEEFRAHTTAMARSAEAEPIAAQVRTPLGIKSAVGA